MCPKYKESFAWCFWYSQRGVISLWAKNSAPWPLPLWWHHEMFQCSHAQVQSSQAKTNVVHFGSISFRGLKQQQNSSCQVTKTTLWCRLFRMRRIYRSSCCQRGVLSDVSLDLSFSSSLHSCSWPSVTMAEEQQLTRRYVPLNAFLFRMSHTRIEINEKST